VHIDDKGRPLNPLGRTGIAGRGLLGKWGANFAADPVITRTSPKHGHLELLVIRRSDTGLKAGDDATEAKWLELTEQNVDELHANHGAIARTTLALLRDH
jgi:ADP-ribose pyrophosphatase